MLNGNNTTNNFAVGDIVKITTDGKLLRYSRLPFQCSGWVVEIIEVVEIISEIRYRFRYVVPERIGETDIYYTLECGIERKF